MKQLRKYALVLCVLPMGACATFGQNVSYSCAGMTTALKVLTQARAAGQLSDAVVKDVDSAITVIDPYCGSSQRPTMTSGAMTAFDQARTLLLNELDKVETK